MKLTDIQACIAHIEAAIRDPSTLEHANHMTRSKVKLEIPATLEWDIDYNHRPHFDVGLILKTNFDFGEEIDGIQNQARVYTEVRTIGDDIHGTWHLIVNYEEFNSASGRLPITFNPKKAKPKKAA